MRKIVYVKHGAYDDNEYVFAVPDGMEINKGDIVLCDTTRGDAPGIATTPMLECPVPVVLEKMGATLPLKNVKQVCGKGLLQVVLCDLSRMVQNQDGLPY